MGFWSTMGFHVRYVSSCYFCSLLNQLQIIDLSICITIQIGWFYPIELNLFSALMPKGQEAELAGFFLYCTQILGWLPPLVFTLFNENPDISISWGGVQLNIWLFLALVCYMMMPSWSRCKEITEDDNKILKSIQLGTMHEAI